MIFLKLTYVTGPEAGTDEYIGPFNSLDDAMTHQNTYGPYDATLEDIEPEILVHWTPETHKEYMEKRT